MDLIKADDILMFWFKEAGPRNWFNGGPAFDAKVRERFEAFTVNLAAQLRRNFDHDWMRNAHGTLALIIALDQFPRNMFRETKGMFAFDDLALKLAKQAVEKGFDLQIPMEQRAFIYLPYSHSETLADQDEGVRLVDMRLENEASLFHAKAHRKLIARFGRFPHRNKILARNSTPNELDYLDSGGYNPNV